MISVPRPDKMLHSFPFLGMCLSSLSKGDQWHLLVSGQGTEAIGQKRFWEICGQRKRKPKGLSSNESEAGALWTSRAQKYPGAEQGKTRL